LFTWSQKEIHQVIQNQTDNSNEYSLLFTVILQQIEHFYSTGMPLMSDCHTECEYQFANSICLVDEKDQLWSVDPDILFLTMKLEDAKSMLSNSIVHNTFDQNISVDYVILRLFELRTINILPKRPNIQKVDKKSNANAADDDSFNKAQPKSQSHQSHQIESFKSDRRLLRTLLFIHSIDQAIAEFERQKQLKLLPEFISESGKKESSTYLL